MSSTTTILQRDTYGPDEPVMAPGDREYRFEFEQPDWDSAERDSSSLASLLSDINDMGRKRTVKRTRFKELFADWHPTDVFCAVRLLTGQPTSHPGLPMDIEVQSVLDAAEAALDVDVDELKDEYSTLAEALITEDIKHHSAEPVSNDVLFGKWVYLLNDAGGAHEQTELLTAMFEQCSNPGVVIQAVLPKMALYCGGSTVLKAAVTYYGVDDEDAWRWYRLSGGAANFYLGLERDTSWQEMYAHAPHSTMKAPSTDAKTVEDDLDQSNWVGQYKYDGARVFVHHAGDGDIRAYTSGMKDVTNALPELDAIDWPDCEFIFDAEATPYDADGNVVPFEKVMTRLTRVGDVNVEDEDTEVVFKFFDCPVWHGSDITDRKYMNRFEIVKRIFPMDNIARTGENLETIFQRSVEDGHEGLVIKRKDGWYEPGGRHSQWYKWKPEPETLDVVVLDVLQGGGKHEDRMGSLKVGLQHDGSLEPVGRVGTGFSDKERDDWWVDHETGDAEGTIIEIEFEDIQRTRSGWGFRFPRFKRRRSKSDADIDTVERAARLTDRSEEFAEWKEVEAKEADSDTEEDGLGELFS